MTTRKRQITHGQIVRVFAERLREIRASRGMKQKDLAAKAQVTVSYVSRLEAGGASPGIDLLERLASALDVNVIDLLPAPQLPESVEVYREQVRRQFEAVVKKSGRETLSMLTLFLGRLAESPAANR